MLWKRVFKEMLAFLTLIGIIAFLWPPCNNFGGPLVPHDTCAGHRFSLPYEDEADGTGSYNEIQTLLAGTADRLDISAGELNRAYYQALSSIIPYPSQYELLYDRETTVPGTGTDDLSGWPGSLFEIMALNLGIPSEEIREAWQATLEKLKKDVGCEEPAASSDMQPL
ncbi:MAG: hypothetical protein JW901_10035 [Dehalococcoidia bacterium]|nr:hypothetical protein [Dehalococcoidia bacterium]